MSSNNKDYQRLDYSNGDFFLVLPSMIPIAKVRVLSAYLQEFKEAIAGSSIWPPETDASLYTLYHRYYKKLAFIIHRRIRCDRLVSQSRHFFFVCTEPVEFRGQLVPGLSGIEQLLGYSYKEEAIEGPEHTTGDSSLDVATHFLLSFKTPIPEESYSIQDLFKMIKLAGEVLESAQKKAEGKEEEVKAIHEEVAARLATDDWWNSKKEAIIGWIGSLGVTIPSE